MIFDFDDWAKLSALFRPGYRGYRPEVKEAPNGDGKVDSTKRYLHVALKYDPPPFAVAYLARAHFRACQIAEELGVRPEFYPRVEDGTLRVLEYPPGAGSEEHSDFDLFTVNCFRGGPGCEAFVQVNHDDGEWLENPFEYHVGEIGSLVGLGHHTPHRVVGQPDRQVSIVYFAMPSHKAKLPPSCRRCRGDGRVYSDSDLGDWRTCPDCKGSGGTVLTVGEWVKERIARSRYV